MNVLFPNTHFSPAQAQVLYSMYFEELQYCTEVGFDGVMINQDHNNPVEILKDQHVRLADCPPQEEATQRVEELGSTPLRVRGVHCHITRIDSKENDTGLPARATGGRGRSARHGTSASLGLRS